MAQLIGRGLTETAELWQPIQRAWGWVEAAREVLSNPDKHTRAQVEQDFTRLLRSIGVTKRHCGSLEQGLNHFLKVTRSYRAGLFHCYDDPAIPRTNNDLEHFFGSYRYQERRATGRKRGTVASVLHGPVRVLASSLTRLRPFSAAELAPADVERWRQLRKAIRERFARRAQGHCFRRDPDAYLARLEEFALKLPLPS